jgi:hypothetical protein
MKEIRTHAEHSIKENVKKAAQGFLNILDHASSSQFIQLQTIPDVGSYLDLHVNLYSSGQQYHGDIRICYAAQLLQTWGIS